MLVNLQFFLRINEPILVGIHHLEQKIDLVIVGVLQVGDLLHRLLEILALSVKGQKRIKCNMSTFLILLLKT